MKYRVEVYMSLMSSIDIEADNKEQAESIAKSIVVDSHQDERIMIDEVIITDIKTIKYGKEA